MSNNTPDYNNDLASAPIGDWADTNPRANTNRTGSSIELVNKIEELNKWLDLKSEYIEKLEKENKKLKEWLDVKEAMIKNCTAEIETQRQMKEFLGKIIGVVVIISGVGLVMDIIERIFE